MSSAETPAPRLWHRWLLLLPFVWQVAAVPWANSLTWTIGSIPFLMVWQMAGVVFTTVIIGLVYALDRKRMKATGA